MSVYVVNIKEPCNGNKTLCEVAQVFKGNIFHRDSSYGSFMVHEEQGTTPEQQRDTIRAYFANRAMPVTEQANDTGHVIFDIDLTPLGKPPRATAADAEEKPKVQAPRLDVLALAA